MVMPMFKNRQIFRRFVIVFGFSEFKFEIRNSKFKMANGNMAIRKIDFHKTN